MNTIIVASARPSAGKTSVILGLTKAADKTFGYIKPFGDRLMYKKKRLWDYDAAVAVNMLGLDDNPEDITIGFEHEKLRYMYDEESTKVKLQDMAAKVGGGKDVLLVEAGQDLCYGASVRLDAISMTRALDGHLLVVVSGNAETVIDDITMVKRYVDTQGVNLLGVVINKVKDVEDFKTSYMDSIDAIGVPVLGILPYTRALTTRSLRLISEALFAKVIAGEEHLDNLVQSVLVGAMSVNETLKTEFLKRKDILIITSGDRTDMILASLEAKVSGIALSNNILPPANIVSRASQLGIPLLLVHNDTFQVAKVIDDMEPLITREDTDKIDLLGDIVAKGVNLNIL